MGMKFDRRILDQCHHLLQSLSCDFVGMAINDREGKELRWTYAVGNRNEKYKKIHVRYGKGMAGRVIRSGSPMTISSFPDQIIGKPIDYPIMLAEKLVAAIAVPVYMREVPWGVLLAGNRTNKEFGTMDQEKIISVAVRFQRLLESNPHVEEKNRSSTCYNSN